MFKIIFSVIKKIIFSFLIIYGYNLLAVHLNATLPINIITVGIVSVLGTPSLIALVLLMKIMY